MAVGDFEDDTFVVYTIQSEGDDYDVVKLVKQYGVYDLDGNEIGRAHV